MFSNSLDKVGRIEISQEFAGLESGLLLCIG